MLEGMSYESGPAGGSKNISDLVQEAGPSTKPDETLGYTSGTFVAVRASSTEGAEPL